MNKAKSTQELILVVHETTQLRQMDSMRRDFISNLSHELRTPVSVIKANSETLLNGALEDKKDAKIFSKAILHNADRLSEMVTSLIDLSRIEYGQLKFVIERVVLNDLIETIVLSHKNKAKKKSIQVLFEHQSDVNGFIKSISKEDPEYIFIEIPCSSYVLNNNYQDFSYPHCSYFDFLSINLLMDNNGYLAKFHEHVCNEEYVIALYKKKTINEYVIFCQNSVLTLILNSFCLQNYIRTISTGMG